MSESNFAPAAAPTEPTDFKAALVGEGMKYQTDEDALKALYHSQAHIAKLEQEAAEREQQVAAKLAEQKTLEDILASIDGRKTEQPPVAPIQGLTPPVAPTVPVEAPEKQDLEVLIQEALTRHQTEKQIADNFARAVQTLDGKYGSRDATNQAVASKAAELGVNVKFLQDLAERSPDGFLKFMAASTSSPQAGPVPKGLNTASLLKHTPGTGPAQPGTYRWYQDLKKSNPAQYRKVYKQQMADMAADTDKFYERS